MHSLRTPWPPRLGATVHSPCTPSSGTKAAHPHGSSLNGQHPEGPSRCPIHPLLLTIHSWARGPAPGTEEVTRSEMMCLLARDSEPLPARLGPFPSPVLTREASGTSAPKMWLHCLSYRPTHHPSLLCHPHTLTVQTQGCLPASPALRTPGSREVLPALHLCLVRRPRWHPWSPWVAGSPPLCSQCKCPEAGLGTLTHFTQGLHFLICEQVFLQILLGHW